MLSSGVAEATPSTGVADPTASGEADVMASRVILKGEGFSSGIA